MYGVVRASRRAAARRRRRRCGPRARRPRRARQRRRRRALGAGASVLRTHWRVLEERGDRGDRAARALRHRHARRRARCASDCSRPPRGCRAAARRGWTGRSDDVKGVYARRRCCATSSRRSPAIATLRERVRERPRGAPRTTSASAWASWSPPRSRPSAARDTARVLDAARRRWPSPPVRERAAHERIAPSTRPSSSSATALEEFAAAVERPRRASSSERIKLRYVGPLPPYSFADDDGGAGMGLITGLLTLPLAPVRGTVWVAEQIHDQAEQRALRRGRDPRAARGARGRPATRARSARSELAEARGRAARAAGSNERSYGERMAMRTGTEATAEQRPPRRPREELRDGRSLTRSRR